MLRLEELVAGDSPTVIGLQNESDDEEHLTRLAVYRKAGKLPLSAIMPVLEALGLVELL